MNPEIRHYFNSKIAKSVDKRRLNTTGNSRKRQKRKTEKKRKLRRVNSSKKRRKSRRSKIPIQNQNLAYTGQTNGLGRLNSSRSYIHSGGRQRNLELVVSELETKCNELKMKVKNERKKNREIKKEKNEMKNEFKKVLIRLKKMSNLERDYAILLKSFGESEQLRQEQKIIIDTMRAEIKRLRAGPKKKKRSTK